MYQILIVDDDPITQLLLKRVLEKQNYQVAVASNGTDGLTLAQQLQPALIICDWMMPGLTGLEVCRQLKANSSLSATFFILLTSRGNLEDRIEGLNAGADEFLAKPIDMNELKARVRAGLRLYQLNRDLQTQKQLLEAELSEAAAYVCSILPQPTLDLTSASVKIQWQFIPSRYLGGDIFDYYWVNSDTLVMYLLDVAGHGLGAALPSVSVLNLLRSRSLSQVNYEAPDEVLSALNGLFQMAQHHERYFTIWYGIYHQPSRELVYASAGHPPAILLPPLGQSRPIQQLKTAGIPIGLFPESTYTSQHAVIEPGSMLYIFSDGVYEILDDNQQIWGIDAFSQVLDQAHQQAKDDVTFITEQVASICQRQSFDDDVSLIKLEFGPRAKA